MRLDKIPDPKQHFIFSMVKSIIRLVGFALLPYNILFGSVALFVAEILGIAEEVV